jgi:excisionase family DNA binding protein
MSLTITIFSNRERPTRLGQERWGWMMNDTAAKEPKVSELITMQEAAQYCGRSHSQVQSYARSGKLRAWKVGMQ